METKQSNGKTVYKGSEQHIMNIALQSNIVKSFEYMIKEQGRTDLLYEFGEAYERLQMMKSGRAVMI